MRVIAASPPPGGERALLRIASDPSDGQRDLALAAVAVLGGAGATDAALAALDDARPAVRAAAASAAGRLRDVRAAPALARATADSSWEVRHAAALALRDLGASGTLYLRQLERGSDVYAADMARHVLAMAGAGP
jgi:HEAT repeat protein